MYIYRKSNGISTVFKRQCSLFVDCLNDTGMTLFIITTDSDQENIAGVFSDLIGILFCLDL